MRRECRKVNSPRASAIGCFTFLAACAVAQLPLAKPTQQLPDGTVSLHASNATVHGTTIRYEPQPHKNTIGYWTKTQDWVSWDFVLSKTGEFSVELTQSCGKGSGGGKYELSVGDQKLCDIVPESGSFTNWTYRVIGTVNLPRPGPYSLSVKPVTKPGLAVMDLRKVVLRPAPVQ
jgi:arylsulfatase A